MSAPDVDLARVIAMLEDDLAFARAQPDDAMQRAACTIERALVELRESIDLRQP